MDYEELLISYIDESEKALLILNMNADDEIEAFDVQQALVEKLSLKDEFELLGENLKSNEIVNILSGYNFKKINQ